MNQLQTKMMLLAGLTAVALMPAARADEWNQKTVVTFSGPVNPRANTACRNICFQAGQFTVQPAYRASV